ncbi:TPR repeat region-containing protein [Nocardiopsis lucentensis]|uniref:TPR repeat region-containing protein n=1 Tax=Nocardiopsis lucentensis TaxID=53441 RepID=UPI00034AEE7F|nr:hypothetical protein [Nocardiopsis lucentensis]
MPEGSYQISIKECDVSVSVLQHQRDKFDEMYSNICGKSASYNAIANTTATEFSDLISADISSAASENETAWGSALGACIHASGVIAEYALAVQSYNNRTEEIQGDFDTAISAADSEDDKEAAVELYQGQADEAWSTLEGKATEVSDMLADGPTPEHIRTLTEAGHIGSVPGGLMYVITGDEQYFAVTPDMDGSEIGETIQLAAEGNEAALERLDESLALMNAFMAYLARKQESGGQLTERELEILNDLNAHLNDKDASESSGQGASSGYNLDAQEDEFFESIEAIRESEHLSEEQREQLTAVIGGSVLTASDERMGGSYENLPEIVRETVGGPRIHSPTSELSGGFSPDWAGDFETLTELFDTANQATKDETGHPLQGGTELSAHLIGTVAGAVESTDTGGAEEETLRTMLEIATQNTDANYTILTGEYPDREYYPGEDEFDINRHYQHPVEFVGPGSQSGTDQAALVAALLSHDWDYGGQSVRGLTDWIAEEGNSSDDAIKERADRAFEGLINIINDPEAQEMLSRTDYDVEVEGGGPDGGDFTWKDAPMGLLNPQISDSFAGIFETYIDEFADTSIMTGDSSVDNDIETEYSPEGGLVINLDDRSSFTSLISGDGDAMGRIFEAAQDYTQDSVYEYFTDPDAAETKDPARSAGLLWNSIGFGMADAVQTRFESHDNSIFDQNQSMGYAVDMMAAGIPDGRVAEPLKVFLKEMFSEDELNAEVSLPDPGQMTDNISARLDETLRDAALGAFHDSTGEGGTNSTSDAIPDEMIDENGNFIRNWSEWDLGSQETRNLRDSTWQDVQEQNTPMPSEDSTMNTHFNDFMGAMNNAMRVSSD